MRKRLKIVLTSESNIDIDIKHLQDIILYLVEKYNPGVWGEYNNPDNIRFNSNKISEVEDAIWKLKEVLLSGLLYGHIKLNVKKFNGLIIIVMIMEETNGY